MRSRSQSYVSLKLPEQKKIKDGQVESNKRQQIRKQRPSVKFDSDDIFVDDRVNLLKPDVSKLQFMQNDNMTFKTKEPVKQQSFFEHNNAKTKAMLDYQYQQKPRITRNWESNVKDSSQLERQQISQVNNLFLNFQVAKQYYKSLSNSRNTSYAITNSRNCSFVVQKDRYFEHPKQIQKKQKDPNDDSIFSSQVQGKPITSQKFSNTMVQEKDHQQLIKNWLKKTSFI